VETPRPVDWLGGRTRGLAIETFAPTRIFALGRAGRVRTLHGPVRVTPLGDTVYLGTVPLPEARTAIVSSLNRFSRVAAYETWLAKAEERALTDAICVDDRLPTPAPLTLDDLFPFTAPGFE
jgi:hypothetical protein